MNYLISRLFRNALCKRLALGRSYALLCVANVAKAMKTGYKAGFVFVLIFSSYAFAQPQPGDAPQDEGEGEAVEQPAAADEVRVDPNNPQLDSGGGVEMETHLIDNFEESDLWFGSMWIDDGIIRARKAQGAPVSVREANAEQARYVLGAKVNFYKRSYSAAAVEPPQPRRIPGITESISVWVKGENKGHRLYAVVKDMKGDIYRVPLGQMNFAGWQKMEGRIPPEIDQDNPAYATPYRKRGLEFISLSVEFDVNDSLGVFFTYFDNLEAYTNMYHERIDLEQARLSPAERNIPLDDW